MKMEIKYNKCIQYTDSCEYHLDRHMHYNKHHFVAFEDDHQYIHNIHIIEIIENYMSKKLEQIYLRQGSAQSATRVELKILARLDL